MRAPLSALALRFAFACGVLPALAAAQSGTVTPERPIEPEPAWTDPEAAYVPGPRTPLEPGWYIVEPCARFSVVIPGGREEVSFRGRISAGEPVLVFDEVREGALVFEAFGRMSLVRDGACLTPAPAGGRPAYLREDVALFDGTLAARAAVWVTGVDGAAEAAYVTLEEGREERVPMRKLDFLRTYLPVRQATDRGWRSVHVSR